MNIDCHVHVRNVYNDLKQVVKTCEERKIDGIVCTDHIHIKNIKARDLNIDEWFLPYDILKEKLSNSLVLLGAELTIDRNDYLIYGLSKENMLSFFCSGCDSFDSVKEMVHNLGGLIYQAHPLRIKRGIYRHMVNLEVDGYEIDNGHIKFKSEIQNLRVLNLSRLFKKLEIAGSDAHKAKNIGTSFLHLCLLNPIVDQLTFVEELKRLHI